MENFKKMMVGFLTLAVAVLPAISNLPVVQAQCLPGPYGSECVSNEAQNPTNDPGYGDEVAPLAQDCKGIGQEFRQPGERPSQSSTSGQSNVPHGKNPNSNAC